MSYELIFYSTYGFYIVFVPEEKMCSIPAYARVSVSVNTEETKNEEIANDWEDVRTVYLREEEDS